MSTLNSTNYDCERLPEIVFKPVLNQIRDENKLTMMN